MIRLLAIACLVVLTACGRIDSHTPSPSAPPASPIHPVSTAQATTTSQGWPRTLQTPSGPLTLKAPPQRIVSTSVTLTGALLSIDAPVIASASVRHTGGVSDQQGFFSQWGAIARARGVKALYQGEVNADAVLAMQPDLIVVAATGGDSALKAKAILSTIAPVLVVNYDDRRWQDVATLLGTATGHEQRAAELSQQFARDIRALRQQAVLPAQPVTAMVYNDDGSGANIWTPESAQGRLLQEIGLQLAPLPASLRQQTVALGRRDIIPVSGERFAEALQGHDLLLFATDDHSVGQLLANPLLTNLPAVQARRVYALGADTFRLDYYSASHLLARLARQYSKTMPHHEQPAS